MTVIEQHLSTAVDTLDKPSVIHRMRAIVILIVLGICLPGAILEITVGSHFVFFFSRQYQSGAWWVFLLLLPIFTAVILREKVQAHLRIRYPTWWVRWLIMIPTMSIVMAGTVVIAPLGWIAAATWAVGGEKTGVPAIVLFVEPYRASAKSCDQHGTLALESFSARICFEGRAELPLQANQAVLVSGHQSAFGFFIKSMSKR